MITQPKKTMGFFSHKKQSQLQNPWILQFNEVAKLHPRVTESSATTRYFSIYVSQAGGRQPSAAMNSSCTGSLKHPQTQAGLKTAGADVMMSFAIASTIQFFPETIPSDLEVFPNGSLCFAENGSRQNNTT
jgi:hypothetical protein